MDFVHIRSLDMSIYYFFFFINSAFKIFYLNSLSSIKIAYEIASNWGVQLSIKELSDAKDIRSLATLIDAPSEFMED